MSSLTKECSSYKLFTGRAKEARYTEPIQNVVGINYLASILYEFEDTQNKKHVKFIVTIASEIRKIKYVSNMNQICISKSLFLWTHRTKTCPHKVRNAETIST